MTLLLIIIFIMFVGLGIPDSILGASWPVIYPDLNLPISMVGYITATVSLFTILSSLLCSKLINKFGAGMVAAVSTLLTALGLFGYSAADSWILLFLLAIPMGLGAGAIDSALNGFVTLHYTASKLSYLHCFYGLGIAAGPFVISYVLQEGTWRYGYQIMAGIQFVIAAIGFITLPMWRKAKGCNENDDVVQKTLQLKQLISMSNVWLSGFTFFFADAILITAGAWCSSYFVNFKGVAPDKAAQITMFYYIGLAVGRFLSGVFADKIGRKFVIKISFWVLFIAIIVFALPSSLSISTLAIFLIGIAVGPIYPNLAHLTPDNFGKYIAQSVIGFQQAMCYAGIMIMPALFGVLTDIFTIAVLPWYLLLMCSVAAITYISLIQRVKKSIL